MHRRHVTPDRFDAIAAELVDPMCYPARFEIMSGRHRNHGRVVMLRDMRVCMVFAEEPAYLDAMLPIGARPSDGAVLERSMRVGCF